MNGLGLLVFLGACWLVVSVIRYGVASGAAGAIDRALAEIPAHEDDE